MFVSLFTAAAPERKRERVEENEKDQGPVTESRFSEKESAVCEFKETLRFRIQKAGSAYVWVGYYGNIF